LSKSNEYSVTEASAWMAAGKLSAVQLAEDSLARVEQREQDVQAWAHIDPQQLLAQARASDHQPRRGPLHGIPFAVKDIIDTADMPTEYGSPIYAGHRPRTDAACVAMLRNAGALVMGKTVTAEFASQHPGKTRNPHNTAHTPGGSSSGSAAAVADFMVPLALGTQTGGSVIRPAAFCGVVGFKPSFNMINRAGVKPNSESLDTVGILARTVPDAALTFSILTSQDLPDFGAAAMNCPRIGFYRTPQWRHADQATAEALEAALPRLAKAGAHVTEAVLPEKFGGAVEAQGHISDYELSRALSYERQNFSDKISATLNKKLAQSDKCTAAQYITARKLLSECRRLLDDVFVDFDILLVPSTPGEAPAGIETTGNAIFNRMWTALHVPAVTVPVFTGPTGLPIGAQLIGPFGMDHKTLVHAEWVRRALT
jgi:Asp-tRNA(Asn)/Glu-tRNA(Gln) amidotransferase A subunit family amidase